MINLKVYSDALERALLSLDKETASDTIREAISGGSAIEIASEIITFTLQNIGDEWEKGNLSLSQVYMSGLICEEVIDQLLPPADFARKKQPKMAIGVFEDHHLLGKRIIYSTLRASGYDLLDLGSGLSIEKLVELVKKEKIKILLLSVLMLPSALRIKKLKEELKESDIKIIVGGAPFRFDEKLYQEVEADYFGKDSSDALQIVNNLMGGKA